MATNSLEQIKSSGLQRSPKWNEVRDAYLNKYPKCIVCGTTEKIQIHHIFPFHFCVSTGRPDLELDDRNFMPLCENELKQNHHLLIGHLDNFESYNPDVKKDIITYKNKTNHEIQSDADWQDKRDKRPKPLSKMTDAEKKDFKKMLDEKLPKK